MMEDLYEKILAMMAMAHESNGRYRGVRIVEIRENNGREMVAVVHRFNGTSRSRADYIEGMTEEKWNYLVDFFNQSIEEWKLHDRKTQLRRELREYIEEKTSPLRDTITKIYYDGLTDREKSLIDRYGWGD